MQYQFYQILLFFIIYSIIGAGLSAMHSILLGEKQERIKVCKGPYCPAFGVGAVLLIVVMEIFQNTPPVAFAVGLVVGSLVEVGTIALAHRCNLESAGRFSWYHPLLHGACAVILMTHGHHLVVLATNRISIWIHFAVLMIFAFIMISDYVEGVARILEKKPAKDI